MPGGQQVEATARQPLVQKLPVDRRDQLVVAPADDQHGRLDGWEPFGQNRQLRRVGPQVAGRLGEAIPCVGLQIVGTNLRRQGPPAMASNTGLRISFESTYG
jgi:hypothetical protein